MNRHFYIVRLQSFDTAFMQMQICVECDSEIRAIYKGRRVGKYVFNDFNFKVEVIGEYEVSHNA